MVQIVHTTILTVLSILLMLIAYINIDFPACIFLTTTFQRSHTPSPTLDIVHFLSQHAKISLDINNSHKVVYCLCYIGLNEEKFHTQLLGMHI